MYAKYHGPSLSGSPYFLLTRFQRFIMYKYSQNFTKVNQVICINYPYSIPDIMIQAQAVLKLFKAQAVLKIIQPNIYRILSKVNQVIYTLGHNL